MWWHDNCCAPSPHRYQPINAGPRLQSATANRPQARTTPTAVAASTGPVTATTGAGTPSPPQNSGHLSDEARTLLIYKELSSQSIASSFEDWRDMLNKDDFQWKLIRSKLRPDADMYWQTLTRRAIKISLPSQGSRSLISAKDSRHSSSVEDVLATVKPPLAFMTITSRATASASSPATDTALQVELTSGALIRSNMSSLLKVLERGFATSNVVREQTHVRGIQLTGFHQSLTITTSDEQKHDVTDHHPQAHTEEPEVKGFEPLYKRYCEFGYNQQEGQIALAAIACLCARRQLYIVQPDPNTRTYLCHDAFKDCHADLNEDVRSLLRTNECIFLFQCHSQNPFSFRAPLDCWTLLDPQLNVQPMTQMAADFESQLTIAELSKSSSLSISDTDYTSAATCSQWIIPCGSEYIRYNPLQIGEIRHYEYNDQYVVSNSEFFTPHTVIQMKIDYLTQLLRNLLWYMLLAVEYRPQHLLMKAMILISITISLALFAARMPFYTQLPASVTASVVSMLDLSYYIVHAYQTDDLYLLETLYKLLPQLQINLLAMYPVMDYVLNLDTSNLTAAAAYVMSGYVAVCATSFAATFIRFVVEFGYSSATSQHINTFMSLKREVYRMKHRHRFFDMSAVIIANMLIVPQPISITRTVAVAAYFLLSVFALYIYFFATLNISYIFRDYVQFWRELDVFVERAYDPARDLKQNIELLIKSGLNSQPNQKLNIDVRDVQQFVTNIKQNLPTNIAASV